MQKHTILRTAAGIGVVAVMLGASACSTPSDPGAAPETSESAGQTPMDSGSMFQASVATRSPTPARPPATCP